MVRFGVLGPLVAEDSTGPLALRGPRHRSVLARLLVARGRVVPVDLLVDDLWPDPPAGAVGAVRTFVADLRRALEPARPPRTPPRLLVTSGPGYALRAEPDAVDAWRFEAAVTSDPSLSLVDEALALWRGPAYAGFEDQAWARAEIVRLDELRLLALDRRAEALLELGRAAEAVPELEARVVAHPLRENGWRLLALALYGAGRQGDALAALRRARRTLADELGVDPGPGLRQVEADILAQAPHLPVRQRSEAGAPAGLVGRKKELARLHSAADKARRGALRLVLVSGDAGAGKTALVEAFAAALGWTTAWGANPDDEGLPPAWPWTRILATLGIEAPGPAAAADPLTERFRRHQAVVGALAEAAASAPLLLVLDDLQWAGAETLALLGSLVGAAPARPILVVATHRDTDLPAGLTEFLARAARAEPDRIYLGGLGAGEVRQLVRATTGRDAGAEAAALIHRRSGGNPFFVRELARLDDPAAVPPGVRDVVRQRLARLPVPVQDVLAPAAVLGDVDLAFLAALAGDVLDSLEAAVTAGFLDEPGPGRFRFAHDLVRDTVYQDLSRSRRARWHAGVTDALARLRPDDVDALTHHARLAGDRPDQLVRYARAAAERAERRVAPHEAARLWRLVLDHGGTDLDALTGLVRALAVAGDLEQARRHRGEAVELAERQGDPVRTAHVIGAFDVPALWTVNDDPALAARIVEACERTLTALPPGHRAERSRLLATLALELRNTGGDRAREAAREAESIARELDDPAVLAFALNARFMQEFDRAGRAPERARIGAELVALGAGHGLVPFEVLGHLVVVQAAAARADLPTADRHARAADELGERYQLPLVGVFTQWYRALRADITGAPAEAAYRAAAARLPGTGMSGLADGIGAFALYCHRGSVSEVDGPLGGYEPWVRPGAGPVPDSPRDLLYEARTCLQAMIAVERAEHAEMELLHAALLPAEDELAGAGSGLLTLRPVAYYLGELSKALGRTAEAAAHFRKAVALAESCGNERWAAAAREALAGLT